MQHIEAPPLRVESASIARCPDMLVACFISQVFPHHLENPRTYAPDDPVSSRRDHNNYIAEDFRITYTR